MNYQTSLILHYGYNPNCEEKQLIKAIKNYTRPNNIQNTEEELQNTVVDRLLKSITDELDEDDYGKTHILPLSSGLDSRAILAGLLKTSGIPRSNIHTVTFGSPGTWDFEIGQKVAREAGVKNTPIDLTDDSFDWSLNAIRDHTRSQESIGRFLESYVNFKSVEIIRNNNSIVWTGFMGDPSIGGHQPQSPQVDWSAACDQFVQDEKYSDGLTHPNFETTGVLPDEPFVRKTKLSYEEQLDFAYRQQCLIKPIVVHSERYRTPFVQPSWLKFSLNLPPQYRGGRRVFKQGLNNEFPDLFSLPTDAAVGLSLSSSTIRKQIRQKRLAAAREIASKLGIDYRHPNTNYINFSMKFRRPGQLKNTMKTLITNFSRRDICDWFDSIDIWNEHQSGADRSKEIRAIASAELFLMSSK